MWLRAYTYNIFNQPLPSLVLGTHHFSNLILRGRIQCTHFTCVQAA